MSYFEQDETSSFINYMGEMNDAWCVYSHSLTKKLIYIGACRLKDVYLFPDARLNSEWIKLVFPTTLLEIKIIGSGSYSECWRAHALLITNPATRPICNAQGYNLTGFSGPIICNETGQEFRNQSDCAAQLGIAQGRLSLHLRGMPGAKKINGLTFRRA